MTPTSPTFSSDDAHFERIELDGQALCIPARACWDALQEAGQLDGRPIATPSILADHLQKARHMPDLTIAFGSTREPGMPWIVYHLAPAPKLSSDARTPWRRVHIEGQSCWTCPWQGTTGNHRDYAIYEGTPDPLTALQNAWNQPQRPCPRCQKALRRPALWVHQPA